MRNGSEMPVIVSKEQEGHLEGDVFVKMYGRSLQSQ